MPVTLEKTIDLMKEKFRKDPYANGLGAELVELAPGSARVKMTFTDKHLNFLGFVHGGAMFSLLDYAFAAASNSHNESAVAVSMSVQFINAPPMGTLVYAEAKEVAKSRKLGLYEMTVIGEDGEVYCRSDGRVYRIGKEIVGE